VSHDVFVSYSTKDKEVADAVCKALEEDGIRCWIAPRDVQPGMEYAQAIIEALNTCRLFLIILSEESNTSPQVRREVERAVSKDLSILTFRIDNTILSKAMEYYLSNRHWLDASNAVLAKQLQSLSEAIQELLRHTPRPPEESGIPLPGEVQVPKGRGTQPAGVPSLAVPPSAPANSGKKRGLAWLWVLLLTLVLGASAYFGLAKSNLPFQSRPAATNMPRPAPTGNLAATARALNVTSIAGVRDAWIVGFAEPILSQIATRPPDFKDDFSNPDWSYTHWNFFEGVTIENGQAVIAARDQWQGTGISAYTSDFVFLFDVTSEKLVSQALSFGFSFRGTEEAYNHFTMGSDGWCGFGEAGSATRDAILSECQSSMPNMEQTTKVTIIVVGDQAAAYVNDQPMLYLNGLLHGGNEISIGASVSEGTGVVTIDDVELWNLNR
jgi:hypothetical protein